MTRYRGWRICVAMAGLVGCAESGPSLADEWRAVRDRVDDTVAVRTVAGSVRDDTGRLEPELRIGTPTVVRYRVVRGGS